MPLHIRKRLQRSQRKGVLGGNYSFSSNTIFQTCLLSWVHDALLRFQLLLSSPSFSSFVVCCTVVCCLTWVSGFRFSWWLSLGKQLNFWRPEGTTQHPTSVFLRIVVYSMMVFIHCTVPMYIQIQDTAPPYLRDTISLSMSSMTMGKLTKLNYFYWTSTSVHVLYSRALSWWIALF